jgi:predicted ATPase
MKEFKVSNFKSVNGEKSFKLAPITLFIGPNGSGKSSILKALDLGIKAVDLTSNFDSNSTNLFFNDELDFKNPKFFNQDINVQNIRNFVTKDLFGNKTSLKEYFNINSDSDIVRTTYPIDLKFFSDEFEVTILLGLNESINTESIPLGLEILNKNENKSLLKFYIFPKNYYLKHYYLFGHKKPSENLDNIICWIQLDLEYTNLQIEKHRDYIIKKNNEKVQEIYTEDDLDKVAADFEKELEENKSRLMSDFNPEEQTYLFHSKNIMFDEWSISELFTYLNQIKEKHKTIDWLKIGIKDFNSEYYSYKDIPKEETNIEDLVTALVKKFQNELLIGIKIDMKNRKNTSFSLENENFSYHFKTLVDVLTSQMDIPEHYQITQSEYFDFIFKNLFVDNIKNGLSSIKLKIDRAIKIYPNRFDYGKENLSSIYKAIIETLDLESLNNPNDEERNSIRRNSPIHFQQFWLKKFKIGESIEFITNNDYQDIVKINGKNGSSRLVDQGFGISQLIPIISLLSNPAPSRQNQYDDESWSSDSLFLIEEPEANLHPNFQSLLADMFIDASYKYYHQLLIETHSEYLVRKFQYWVAKGKIRPDDIIIYYFDNQNENPVVKDVVIKKISINKDGSLSETFGEGFFDEADKIALELFLLKKHQTN